MSETKDDVLRAERGLDRLSDLAMGFNIDKAAVKKAKLKKAKQLNNGKIVSK